MLRVASTENSCVFFVYIESRFFFAVQPKNVIRDLDDMRTFRILGRKRFSPEQVQITAVYGMGHSKSCGQRRERFLVSLFDQFGVDHYRWVDASVVHLCMKPIHAEKWIALCRGPEGECPAPRFEFEARPHGGGYHAQFVPLTGSSDLSTNRNRRTPTACIVKAYINAVGNFLTYKQVQALRDAPLTQRTLNPFLLRHKYPFIHHTPISASSFPTDPGKYLIFVDEGRHCRFLVVSDDGSVTVFSDRGDPLVPATVAKLLKNSGKRFQLAEIFERPAKKPKLLPRPTKIRKRLAQRKAYNKQKKKKYKSSGTYLS